MYSEFMSLESFVNFCCDSEIVQEGYFDIVEIVQEGSLNLDPKDKSVALLDKKLFDDKYDDICQDMSNNGTTIDVLIKRASEHMLSDVHYGREASSYNDEKEISECKKYKLGYAWRDPGDNYILYSFSKKKFYFNDHECGLLENLKRGPISENEVLTKIKSWKH